MEVYGLLGFPHWSTVGVLIPIQQRQAQPAPQRLPAERSASYSHRASRVPAHQGCGCEKPYGFTMIEDD
jgi:hypothetical protein